MDLQFYSSAPHAKARPRLDEILANGSKRIMIACAFCTNAGVEVLRRHIERLRLPGSCLVVSAENPTDIPAVNCLAEQAPGAVWMHNSGPLPREMNVGRALMHSKVFYSDA